MAMICNMACSCGQNIEFSAEDAGRTIRCPTCQSDILLQMDYEAEAAEPQVPPKRYRLNFRRLLTSKWTWVVVGLLAFIILIILAPQLIMIVILPAIWLFPVAVYFLPCFVGRHKRNVQAIAVLNLLLGWTIIGWIIALVWACTLDPEEPK